MTPLLLYYTVLHSILYALLIHCQPIVYQRDAPQGADVSSPVAYMITLMQIPRIYSNGAVVHHPSSALYVLVLPEL